MQKVQTFLLAIITGALVVPTVVNYQKQRAEEMRLDQAYEKCTPAFVSRTNRLMYEALMDGRRIYNENYFKEHVKEPLDRYVTGLEGRVGDSLIGYLLSPRGRFRTASKIFSITRLNTCQI